MKSSLIFSYKSKLQRSLAIAMEQLIQQKKFAEAVQYFVDECVAESDRDGALVAGENIEEAAYYYAAWLQVAEGRYELASEYLSHIPAATMEDSGLLPYPTFHANVSQLYDRLKARTGKGGVLVASMPKSASSYVSSIISALTDTPIVRASFGQYPRLVAVPCWLDTLRKLGGVTHDHLLPTPLTVEGIISAGIADVFIQYRDPRAAAWSAYMQHPEHPEIERFTGHLEWFNEWLDGWLRIRESKPPFRLHFISYDDVSNNPRQVFQSILEISGYEIAPDALEATVTKAAGEKHRYNFRRGDPREWRKRLPSQHLAQADVMLSPRVSAFLGNSNILTREAIKVLVVPSCGAPYDQRMVAGLAGGFQAIGYEARALPGPLPPAELARMCEITGANTVIQINGVRDPGVPLPANVRHIAWFQDVFPESQAGLQEGVAERDMVYALGDPGVLGLNVKLPCYVGSLVTGVDDAVLKFPQIQPTGMVDFSLCGFIPPPMPVNTGKKEKLLLAWDRMLAMLPLMDKSELLWLARKVLFRRYLPVNYVPYAVLRLLEEIARKTYRPLRGNLDIHELAEAMRKHAPGPGGPAVAESKRVSGLLATLVKPHAARFAGRRDLRGLLVRYLLAEHSAFAADPVMQFERAVNYFARDYPRLLDRELLINEILKVSDRLELYGPGWAAHAAFRPYAKGVIDDQDELLKVYQRSRMNLANNTHGLGLHSRTLECMAVGGFIFTHGSPHDNKPGGMFTSFEPGVHYGMYSPENLIEEASRWLGDEKGRVQAGRNAAVIIREQHCWHHRARQIIEDLQR